jgi:hypothetical protein
VIWVGDSGRVLAFCLGEMIEQDIESVLKSGARHSKSVSPLRGRSGDRGLAESHYERSPLIHGPRPTVPKTQIKKGRLKMAALLIYRYSSSPWKTCTRYTQVAEVRISGL